MFNTQECASVNETAPSFVGCSPPDLSSSATSDFQSAASLASSTSAFNPETTASLMISTITGSVLHIPTSLNSATPVTATFNGQNPVLIGTCTDVSFAMATDVKGDITEFPEIGCSQGERGCCPDHGHIDALLTRCPQDYYTVASACCPT